jgi:glycosyltransferase involved in cell wall biosynthesis
LNFEDVTVIIPAYNEERTIGGVVRALRKYRCGVLVIDDGSCDGTADVARKAGVEVVLHGRNKGYLEALRTVLNWLREGYQC